MVNQKIYLSNYFREVNMNEFVKIEIARDILNVMIGANGQRGFDRNNKTLMQLLEDETAFKKGDKEVVDKILKVYGPMVREHKYIL